MASAIRVHALDARTLDRELNSLLSSYWERATSHLGPSLRARLQPELQALLGAAAWALSARAGEPTPGQALLGLRTTAARAADLAGAGPALLLGRRGPGGAGKPTAPRPPLSRRLGLLAAAVLLPYLWARLGRALAAGGSTPEDAERRLRWWRRLRRVEAAAALAGAAPKEHWISVFFVSHAITLTPPKRKLLLTAPGWMKRNRSHTQTHDTNNTANDHTKSHTRHLTTIKGGAAPGWMKLFSR